MIYDIDDNNLVDFGDLSFFAPAFGQPVGGNEPPFTWWADFDKTGLVDFGDLSFFSPNFGKGRPDASIVLPPNFPAAWLPPTAAEGKEAGPAIAPPLLKVDVAVSEPR